MRVFIENNSLFFNEVDYIFNLFCINKGIKYERVGAIQDSEISISTDENADIRISKYFYELLRQGKYNHLNYFENDFYFHDSLGFVDYLSTAFYMVNVIQEKNSIDLDKFGRYKYSNSYQFKFNCIKDNIVQDIFNQIQKSVPKLAQTKVSSTPSKIFLSHDIDTIYGSLMQDGFYSIKKLRPDLLFMLLLYNIKKYPYWLNIDRIMKVESEYDFRSTFYWLVNKGKTKYGLSNSDYIISNPKVQKIMRTVNESEWENGLHKSASDESFNVEMNKMPVSVVGNRFHYIKFKPHIDYQKIENAKISFDSSLGFADAPGFRNSYGQPFKPFNLEDRKQFNFVECPLHIMDTTYYNYLKLNSDQFANDVIKFVELNSTNSVLTILFHNNFISNFKYKDYFKSFRKLLKYFYESDFGCITQSEIIKEYNK